MGKRRSIQLLSMQTPLRQVLVHDRDEPIVMVPLDEVHEFVDNYIFEALRRLLSEFEVQPDATSFDSTGAPLGFHFLDAPAKRPEHVKRLRNSKGSTTLAGLKIPAC